MSTAATTSPSRPIILCVEDEADLRRDLVEELEEAGYQVLEAGTGEVALQCLADCRPDLVLCDISMPGASGYAVLRALRDQHDDRADIPFVFLSALGDPREVVAGKRSGADDYLVKPVDFDVLLATVETRLRQVARFHARSRDELERVRSSFKSMGSADLPSASAGAEQALDLVATGVVLLDRDGKVCLANRRARQIAAESEALEIGSRITCRSSRQQAALGAQIERVIHLALNGEEGTASHALPRPNERRDLMVVASSIPAGRGSRRENCVAALFISDPESGPVVSSELLSSLFSLTPTEGRIAQELAGGKRPSLIAHELGIAQTTVAFHIRNLFQKTGTSRQAELVALILASPAPLD